VVFKQGVFLFGSRIIVIPSSKLDPSEKKLRTTLLFMGKGSQRLLLPSAKLDPSKKSPRKLSTFFSSREGSVGDDYMI